MKNYPKKVKLVDGSSVMIRRMLEEDASALHTFFLNLPDESRLVLKDNVTDRAVIDRWARELDYDEVLPILALSGEHIVGDATLHRHKHGWSKHVGEFRVVVAPQFRKRGLGSILAREIVQNAVDFGLEKITCEIMEEQEALRKLLERAGFQREATLTRYIKDIRGKHHDLVIMTHDVTEVWRALEDMMFYKDFSTL
jgi:RimJ/RimL family protein N-acetyltransferase